MKFPRATVALLVLAAFGTPGARAEPIRIPNMPFEIQVLAPNHVYFVGHGVGTQNYVCLPSGSGVKFTLFTPQATLFNDDLKEITTHYFSPNLSPDPSDPLEAGAIRATWQHARDTSTVWARATASSTDQNFVALGAVAWVKLLVTGRENGPTGGDALTKTTFVQRLNTAGGLAPSTGCNALTDIGAEAFVPYKADYFFYTDQ